MDSSEAHLDTIEAQRSTSRRTLGEGISLGETNPVPEFLTKLRLSDLYHLPGESVPMSPEIFSKVSAGTKECLEMLGSSTQMSCLKNDQGDSVLHIAASWGHLGLVKEIVCECPSLLLVRNLMDQLPLHVASDSGCLAVVEALIEAVTYCSERTLSGEERERLNVYVLKDKDKNTPLHAALKERYWEIAACLVDANQRASFLDDKDQISPLYLAVEAGKTKLVKAMLNIKDSNGLEGRKSKLDSQLEGRKYLVHRALKARNTDILDIILKEYPSLESERDEEGRTCLSYGASIGFYEGVSKLLLKSLHSVYRCDKDGSFPIHMAVKNGHSNVVKEILKQCPYAKQLINKQGQNILHIAAKSGKHLLVMYLAERGETKHLSGAKDFDGNTPLHLATVNWNHEAVRALARSNTLYKRNKRGLTALDIAESNLNSNNIYHERMTLMVLLLAHSTMDSHQSIKSITKPSNPPEGDTSKNYINALLLVAALVATVTFAAGFTIPGGYNSSAPDLGRATLATNPSLFAFLVLDTLSMQCSVVAIATLIWAQLGDAALAHLCVARALPFLLSSLVSMPVAFFFGVVLTVGHAKGLLVVISIISVTFFIWVLAILVPQFLLQLPHVHPIFGEYIVTSSLATNDSMKNRFRKLLHLPVS